MHEGEATLADPIPNRIAYPGDVYTDPITGYDIPKSLVANLEARKALVQYGNANPDAVPTIITRCRQSFTYWCNFFAWTYRVNETHAGRTVAVKEDGAHVPFITWPVQDEAAAEIISAMDDGRDLLIDKSRDMGASWLLLAIFHWKWLFYKDVQLREISRKEEYVDSGSSKSLFWKHDYLHRFLPDWMRPAIDRKAMHLHNKVTGSTINGESTNKDAVRGDRAMAILIDEAAAIDKLEAVLRATDQAGPRLFNSTPEGPGTFCDLRFSGKIRVVVLPWYRHPEKGVGAEPTYDKHGQMRWNGPWRQLQVDTKTPREVAQNVDIDHAAAGAMFFDPFILTTHRASYAQEPWVEGTLVYARADRYGRFEASMRKGEVSSIQLARARQGLHDPRHLRLWFDPGSNRPDAAWRVVIGVDISHGAGASQSCACAADAITGVKLAELVDADLDPVAFADLVAMMGWWFGAFEGKGAALIVPEANGPGGMFIRRLQQISYPHIYRHVPSGKSVEATGQTLGWVSNRQEKETKLGQYAQALMSGRYQNRSTYALSQCEQYVYQKSGAVGPGNMEAADGSARAVHGDIVIADMLTVEGMLRVGRYEIKEHEPPVYSPAWRMRQDKLAKVERDSDDW